MKCRQFFLSFSMVLVSFFAHAHNAPASFPPSYQPITYPVPVNYASIPWGCYVFNWFAKCHRSANTELALEREFWARVQNLDENGMRDLLHRIKLYALSSNSPYNGRLYRLVAFGNVMVSQATSDFTIDKVPQLLAARSFAGISDSLQPNNVNTLSIAGFTDILQMYAIGFGGQGNKIAKGLIDLKDVHGDPGLEAVAVGAMAFTYTTSPKRINRGLRILADCKTRVCTRTTSLSPFKQVGIAFTIAEAQVALNNKEAARQVLSDARDFANNNYMPAALMNKVDEAIDEILNGRYSREAPSLKGIGLYRLPAGPSQNYVACALCHAGATVPEHYYSWK